MLNDIKLTMTLSFNPYFRLHICLKCIEKNGYLNKRNFHIEFYNTYMEISEGESDAFNNEVNKRVVKKEGEKDSVLQKILNELKDINDRIDTCEKLSNLYKEISDNIKNKDYQRIKELEDNIPIYTTDSEWQKCIKEIITTTEQKHSSKDLMRVVNSYIDQDKFDSNSIVKLKNKKQQLKKCINIVIDSKREVKKECEDDLLSECEEQLFSSQWSEAMRQLSQKGDLGVILNNKYDRYIAVTKGSGKSSNTYRINNTNITNIRRLSKIHTVKWNIHNICSRNFSLFSERRDRIFTALEFDFANIVDNLELYDKWKNKLYNFIILKRKGLASFFDENVKYRRNDINYLYYDNEQLLILLHVLLTENIEKCELGTRLDIVRSILDNYIKYLSLIKESPTKKSILYSVDDIIMKYAYALRLWENTSLCEEERLRHYSTELVNFLLESETEYSDELLLSVFELKINSFLSESKRVGRLIDRCIDISKRLFERDHNGWYFACLLRMYSLKMNDSYDKPIKEIADFINETDSYVESSLLSCKGHHEKVICDQIAYYLSTYRYKLIFAAANKNKEWFDNVASYLTDMHNRYMYRIKDDITRASLAVEIMAFKLYFYTICIDENITPREQSWLQPFADYEKISSEIDEAFHKLIDEDLMSFLMLKVRLDISFFMYLKAIKNCVGSDRITINMNTYTNCIIQIADFFTFCYFRIIDEAINNPNGTPYVYYKITKELETEYDDLVSFFKENNLGGSYNYSALRTRFFDVYNRLLALKRSDNNEIPNTAEAGVLCESFETLSWYTLFLAREHEPDFEEILKSILKAREEIDTYPFVLEKHYLEALHRNPRFPF